jgi:N-acetylmuramoyl-L-alanine amidase
MWSEMLRKYVFVLTVLLTTVLSAFGADQRFVLVIDAGHGGHDSGAKGAISYEKNLTLRYALAFGKAVQQNCPDVKVIFTRTSDVFLPLHERADIANRNKADLFMSFHINALEGGRISHGFQSYTLGTGERTGSKGLRENVEVAKRENSVIFLEKDYATRYRGLENSAESDIMFEFIADKNRERSVDFSRLLQREVCKATGRVNGGPHQNNLAVLRLTSMPAILLELGFITTPDEETYLNTDSALDAYTQGILNAFVAYKKKYGGADINIPFRDNDDDDDTPLKGTPAKVSASDDDDDDRPVRKVTTTRRRSQKPQAKQGDSTNKQDSDSKKVAPKRQISSSQPKVVTSKPVFKVQIFSSKVKVKDGSSQFKGLKGCESYEEGSYTKYTYGASNNYNEIYRLRKELIEKFPTAFIVAFKDGKKMDVNEGIKEFLANKKK